MKRFRFKFNENRIKNEEFDFIKMKNLTLKMKNLKVGAWQGGREGILISKLLF